MNFNLFSIHFSTLLLFITCLSCVLAYMIVIIIILLTLKTNKPKIQHIIVSLPKGKHSVCLHFPEDPIIPSTLLCSSHYMHVYTCFLLSQIGKPLTLNFHQGYVTTLPNVSKPVIKSTARG